MPTLELSKNWADGFWTYAAMAHPSNERHRNVFVAAVVAKVMKDATKDCEGDIEIPASMLDVLLNAPGYEDIVNRATNAAKKGCVAGDILDYVAQMYLAGHKQPSVRKAIYVAEDYLSNAVDGYGKKSGSSSVFIYDCWNEYKTVAHLWAAFRVLQFSSPQEENKHIVNNDNPLLQLHNENLDIFLVIAETFRAFGESYVPPVIKSREPLLPKDQTWKVPENYSLPSISLSASKGMPNWMIDRLNGYSKRNI